MRDSKEYKERLATLAGCTRSEIALFTKEKNARSVWSQSRRGMGFTYVGEGYWAVAKLSIIAKLEVHNF